MNYYERQFIGVLTENGEAYGRNNVFLNQQSSIQYLVKSLLLPSNSSSFVSGYLSSFDADSEIQDDDYLSEDERIDNFYSQVKDMLFIYNYRLKENGYSNIVKATLIKKPSSIDHNTMFYAIPVFCSSKDSDVKLWEEENKWKLYRDYLNIEDFLESIKSKKSVGSIYGYDADVFTPSFVIWKGEDTKLYAIGSILGSRYNTLGGLIFEMSNNFIIDISDFTKFVIYNENINPTLMYIPENIYELINNRLQQESVSINNQADLVLDNLASETTVQESIVELTKPSSEMLINIDSSVKNDELIINTMEYHSQKRGLFYNIKDFVNIHTSLKCNNLVILSGMSGTGKSAIVDIYARALGINSSANPDENRLLVIPVRPSWNDDSDLLGYVDLIHMVYRASDSGFVDFLVKSQREENKNKLFLVCFDEMNLARVEHYFSQFLSILERPVTQREIQLYDKQYIGRLYNSADYPNCIKLGDNIRFIGTVNIDESTYHFSDKVLDRANVIQLNILDYSKDWIKKNYGTLSNINWSVDDYDLITTKNAEIEMSEVQSFLWDIHMLLQSASSKYGVGPRIVKSIKLYLLNLPKNEMGGFTYSDAIDYQIEQRVLTKVRGPEMQLGSILDSKSDNNFFTIFDKYKNMSTFERSKEVIIQKKKELETHGYCI